MLFARLKIRRLVLVTVIPFCDICSSPLVFSFLALETELTHHVFGHLWSKLMTFNPLVTEQLVVNLS